MITQHSQVLKFILEIPCMLVDYCDLRTPNRLALLRTSPLLYDCNRLTLLTNSENTHTCNMKNTLLKALSRCIRQSDSKYSKEILCGVFHS